MELLVSVWYYLKPVHLPHQKFRIIYYISPISWMIPLLFSPSLNKIPQVISLLLIFKSMHCHLSYSLHHILLQTYIVPIPTKNFLISNNFFCQFNFHYSSVSPRISDILLSCRFFFSSIIQVHPYISQPSIKHKNS